MLEEHKLPLDSFIGGWYISPNICDSLIDLFKKNTYKKVFYKLILQLENYKS